ncbi:MAG: hypothetical protein EOO92_00820 [Pedobacter sp.]|nr:MAG: hypothetical protein EOO92_00820 [Pedobacter sp.]
MLLQSYPPDGGIVYTETNLDHFFPEPFNMISSALFLMPALYWIIKLRGFNRQYLFLSIAMYLLLTGCIGSTVYHGLRQWTFFIFMDWVPIALLCLMASVYFWYKLLGKWYHSVLALLIFLSVTIGIYKFLPLAEFQLAISINYGVMVLMIVLPLTLLLIKMKGHNTGLVVISLIAFAVALFFRVADKWEWISMGTHFLWHVFGAVATTVIFRFIYQLNDYKEG